MIHVGINLVLMTYCISSHSLITQVSQQIALQSYLKTHRKLPKLYSKTLLLRPSLSSREHELVIAQ